jgi:hypothetical protein
MKSSCQLKGIKTECAMAINKNEKAEQQMGGSIPQSLQHKVLSAGTRKK